MVAAPDGNDELTTRTVAFEEFTRPWRVVARNALAGRLGPSLARHLTAEAQRGLERLLTSRLSDTLSLALFGEFTAFRSVRSTPWERLIASTEGGAGRRLYDEFVRGAAAGGLSHLLRDHPVLADLTATLADQWVEGCAEMVERLDRDIGGLAATFGGGEPLGRVAEAVTGLSDPHHGGRTVAMLTFDSGVRVVYKPKDLGTEWAFGLLLAWLDASGDLPLRLRAPAVLRGAGYGWAEDIEPTPCADDAALGRYYRRAGMLACVVFALAGFDCHRENVIASGEHPVLVDVECMLGHRPVVGPDALGVHQIALDELRSGVLGTGLLPSWQVDEEDGGAGARDISGLHVPHPDELVERARRWEHVNTDAMALRVGPVRVDAVRHVPVVAGRWPSAPLVEHADELLDGFDSCYRVIVGHREALLAADGPFATLAQQRVRFLFRNTRVYGSLHHQLLHPRFLRSWAERDVELQRLRRGLVEEGMVGRWGAVVDSEVEALNRCDVPHFTALPEGDTLYLDGDEPVAGCLREPSHQLVVERIRGMGDADLSQQLGFLAGSLHTEAARRDAAASAGHRSASHRAAPSGRPSLLDAALAVAREVEERAVRSEGAATWIAPQYLPRLERYQLQPIGLDLHSGGCGPAVFLAAAAALTGDRSARRTALEALRPVRQALDRSPADVRRALGSGGATGVGSVVYALVACAALLQEDPLLETAARAAGVIDEQHLATAELDVFSGVAGDLLGLLALQRATGDAEVLVRAVRCGDWLVESARPAPQGGQAWPTLGSRLLTGFSHGAAGIIYALARLAGITGTARYADAARAGVRYEDTTFDDVTGNWPDLREDDQPAFKVNWCHGAPGIGLARLGTWRSLADADLLTDVERAVATTLSLDLDGPDHLCCGNLGRAELLLSAGAQLGRIDLTEEARTRTASVVQRAGEDGGYRLHSSLPRRVHMPGFFMGLSGVGYALLRTAHPDVLPSVLSWD